MAEILADFRTLQYYIAAAPVDPEDQTVYWTDGWALLRQCAIDGQHILNCAADVSVPQTTGGEIEQDFAELKQYVNSSKVVVKHNADKQLHAQSLARRLRAQARSPDDLPSPSCSAAMDHIPGAGPSDSTIVVGSASRTESLRRPAALGKHNALIVSLELN